MRVAYAAVFAVAAFACSSEVTIEEVKPSATTPAPTSTTAPTNAPSSMPTPTPTMTPTTPPPNGGCTASNYLSHDSFDVVAEALQGCFDQNVGCTTHTATSIYLPNLDEGNGDVSFDYTTAADGTHTLVGHGNPDAAPAPPGIVLQASGIPANVSLDQALSDFYFELSTFACVWQ